MYTIPCFIYLLQGFSTFGTRVPPNLNCTPLRTPKSELYALCVPPNEKLYQKWLLLSYFFNFAYPLCPFHVPLGVLVPQVENRCSKVSCKSSLMWHETWLGQNYLQSCFKWPLLASRVVQRDTNKIKMLLPTPFFHLV